MDENRGDPRLTGYVPPTPGRRPPPMPNPILRQGMLSTSENYIGDDREDQPGEELDSPVYAQLRRAQMSLDQAIHMLGNLYSRLEPILAPERPEPRSDETMKVAEKPLESSLVSSIRQLDNRAVEILKRLATIDNLLEL